MPCLQRTQFESGRYIKGPFLAATLRSLVAVAAFIPADSVMAQEVSPLCRPRHGSAVTICGLNGGTSSQIFSPGSVIIMRQDTPAFPGDLPNSSLPAEIAAAREGMAFLGSRLGDGEEITWSLTGFGVYRDQSGTETERGYSSDRGGIVAGMRVKRSDYTLFFGIDASSESQSYERSSLNFLTPNGDSRVIPVPPASMDRDDFGLTFGGSLDLRPGLVWHAVGRFGRIDTETRRLSHDLRSTDGSSDSDTAPLIKRTFIGRGSSEGWAVAMQTGLSYGRALGSGLYGGLSGSFLYAREDFSDFTEHLPGGGEGFTFGDDDRTSVLSRLGIEVARPYYIKGAVVVPSIRAAWLHEFSDDSRIIDVHAPIAFTGTSFPRAYDFTIKTNDPDRDYFTVGASVGALFGDGRGSLAVDYETIVGHDFIDEYMIGLRIGYRF